MAAPWDVQWLLEQLSKSTLECPQCNEVPLKRHAPQLFTGPRIKQFVCNQRFDSWLLLISTAVTVQMAPSFSLWSYYLVMRRIMLLARWGRVWVLPTWEGLGSSSQIYGRQRGHHIGIGPNPADKQPSGSVTEWCITAPLGRLTRVGSFCSDLGLDFQMLSVGSSSRRWMIWRTQVQLNHDCHLGRPWSTDLFSFSTNTPVCVLCCLHCDVTCMKIHVVCKLHIYNNDCTFLFM